MRWADTSSNSSQHSRTPRPWLILYNLQLLILTLSKSQTLNPKIGVKQDFGDKMSSLWRLKADTGPHTDWCTRTQTHSHEPQQQQTQTQMDTKGGGKNSPQCLQRPDNWSYCSVVSVHPVRDTTVVIPMVMSRRMSIHIYIYKRHLSVWWEPKYRSISSSVPHLVCVMMMIQALPGCVAQSGRGWGWWVSLAGRCPW